MADGNTLEHIAIAVATAPDLVGPGAQGQLPLVEATTDEHRSVVGRQAGGRVAFFLKLTDFDHALPRWAGTEIDIVENVTHPTG